mgnify:CR=1 FL=1
MPVAEDALEDALKSGAKNPNRQRYTLDINYRLTYNFRGVSLFKYFWIGF